ncbi:MAG: MoaD/ThiS family protein [Candidatus Aminicenantales bacterium]
MKIHIKIIGHLIYDAGFSEKAVELPASATAENLIARLNIPREKPKILTRNGKAVNLQEELADGDRIVIAPIYSGG